MTWDLARIGELLAQAGEIALRSKRTLERRTKSDRSIVTQVDRAVEDLLTRELEDEARGVRIIGEETVDERGEDYIRAALAGTAYVIDPIDGTSPYAYGMPNWGVSVGLLEGGRLTHGAVHLPEFGEIVASDGQTVVEGRRGGNGWMWRTLEPTPVEDDPHCLLGITQRVAKRGRIDVPHPVQVLGAAVVPLVGLTQGRFRAYLGSVKLWDIAGALPLVLRHGFVASVVDSGEVRRVYAEVDESAYHLAAGSDKRWMLRSELLVCRPADEAWLRAAFEESST